MEEFLWVERYRPKTVADTILPEDLKNTFEGLSTPGLGTIDFGMDAVGMLPGGAALDDKWDEATKLDNPWHQNIRRISSVVIPAILLQEVYKNYLQLCLGYRKL